MEASQGRGLHGGLATGAAARTVGCYLLGTRCGAELLRCRCWVPLPACLWSHKSSSAAAAAAARLAVVQQKNKGN
ncbi:L-lactate dehydrogenase A chain [Frankliniella fusca]|uniref:L-lactate dehydrogenase A chain n=1 Tax=Frankliniella fusca TaxID=407009 RepID=A0AAE1LG38_9NEOP|nr:L-lactate dehydrogenase A chain [Frankliniella fusca]